jgi:hypothetical protein
VTIPTAGYLIALLSSLHGIVFVISLGMVLLLAASIAESMAPAPPRVPGRSRQTKPVSRRAADPT